MTFVFNRVANLNLGPVIYFKFVYNCRALEAVEGSSNSDDSESSESLGKKQQYCVTIVLHLWQCIDSVRISLALYLKKLATVFKIFYLLSSVFCDTNLEWNWNWKSAIIISKLYVALELRKKLKFDVLARCFTKFLFWSQKRCTKCFKF